MKKIPQQTQSSGGANKGQKSKAAEFKGKQVEQSKKVSKKSAFYTKKEMDFDNVTSKKTLRGKSMDVAKGKKSDTKVPDIDEKESDLDILVSKNKVSVPGEVKPIEGYHFEMTMLTKEELKPYLRYIALAGYAHRPMVEKLIKPFGYEALDPNVLAITQKIKANDMLKNVEVVSGVTKSGLKTAPCFADRTTGLKVLISVHEGRKEVILTYGMASSLDMEFGKKGKKAKLYQYLGAAGNLLGDEMLLYKEANVLTKEIVAEIRQEPRWEKYSIKLTGKCLGGSLAQFVGLSQELDALCTNTFPLGAGSQTLIGDDKLKQADRLITHITVTADIVSDFKGIARLDSLLCEAGIRTPGNFGLRYEIPSAYSDWFGTHGYVFSSAMEYLGIDKNSIPLDLEKSHPELLQM